MFHFKAGTCVSLSNNFKTANRDNPTQEFNRGLVFSLEPLKDDEVFEVKIDKKLHTWNGSIEIGVTVSNPDVIDVPITATDLRGGTWIMLGQGVLRDGRSLHEAYGNDLDKLVEGDRVGVLRTSTGDLQFLINGISQGVAATNLPSLLYAVIDMYGKCSQITVTNPTTPEAAGDPLEESLWEISNKDTEVGDSSWEEDVSYIRRYSENDQTRDRPALAPTASEEASLTEPNSGSALTNHVANISIANSFISTNDSNGLDDCVPGVEGFEPTEWSQLAAVLDEDTRRGGDTESNNHEELKLSAGHLNNIASNVTEQHIVPGDSLRRGRRRSNQNHINNMATYSRIPDRLCFHSKCGSLVKLSGDNRTAERKRPFDEFNNGVVMSNRELLENELFQIRIDRLVDKWSGSIEMGISTHNPDLLEFPATMTNMRSGTIMMSGTGILTNGKGTLREYGDFNLDELKEGDKIGMIIKEGRYLHYFINGIEQGVASNDVPTPVWAVVDLYGMTVKVTILTGDETDEMIEEELINGTITSIDGLDDICSELLFHPNCGNYAAVINAGRTAHRPHASEDFNNGVVLTQRPLLLEERFEVQLDVIVVKWAGSLEIGVTTHDPTDLEFPSTMTNVRSGTWLMTTSGVTYNGTTIIETYGRNFDTLKVGECVGVCRKSNGSLHFYINNEDQGVAATNVPDIVYGIIDLYGQAAQATILQNSSHPNNEIANSMSSMMIRSDLKFHPLHGRNAHIMRGGLVAVRPNATSEFNDAIVMSNRQLKDDEMFEVVIDKMVDRWSGSLEVGMTAIAPEQMIFPSTMTDIDYETWMLSGSSVMCNGYTIHTNYSCDLDMLQVGTRIGMMRHSNRSLHYYINGADQGEACENLPSGLWAVIDLYGECGQVSMVFNQSGADQSRLSQVCPDNEPHVAQQNRTEVLHRWSKCCGANVSLNSVLTVATIARPFTHGLVFSSTPVEEEELFEVKLNKVFTAYAGSLKIGLTALPISDSYSVGSLPSSLSSCDVTACWWIDGTDVRRTGGSVLKLNYCPSLSRLREGDRVGVKKTSDGNMKICINGEDFGIAASNVSKDRLFAVIELTGSSESICITSSRQHFCPSNVEAAPLAVSQDSLEVTDALDIKDKLNFHEQVSDDTKDSFENQQQRLMCFHENSGRNIQLSGDKNVASRIESYNQGIVISSRPLTKNVIFQVKMGALNSRWSGSLMVGVTSKSPELLHLPNSFFDMKKNTWIICGDSVYFNGVKIKGRYGPDLDSLSGGSGSHVIGILVDLDSRLHLYVNGIDQGVAAKEIPAKVYAVFDLYGQCQELIIKNGCETEGRATEVADVEHRRSHNHTQNHQIQQLQQSTPDTDDFNQNNEINTLRRDRSIQFTEHSPQFDSKSKKNGQRDTTEGAIKNCEYQNVCGRFRSSLALPDSYFIPEGLTCFCETCHKIRGDGMFHSKGNPPQRYAQPVNWCRYALVSAVGENNDSWHMAYHGTIPGAVRRMLDRGELLFSGELGPTAGVAHRNAKDDDSDGSVLYFSPFVGYASMDAFGPSVSFSDETTGKEYDVRTVLQVAVEPGSYKMATPSYPFRQMIDSSQESCGQNIEWVTKERGATHLLALLVNIVNKSV